MIAERGEAAAAAAAAAGRRSEAGDGDHEIWGEKVF
jgi:hypothetical protein